MIRIRHLLTLLLAFSLFGAACGDSDDPAASVPEVVAEEGQADESAQTDVAPSNAGFPVTIESAGGTWTLESAPQRIVSLSPTATEMLFAIGAGQQVVAVDAFSNYPPEAPLTDLSGFDPNIEAIVGFEPDLVVLSNDANDLIAGLTALGIPVLVSSAPFDIEGGYGVIADLGIAAGRVDETAVVIADLRIAIDEALAVAPEVSLRVYHELDETYFSASSFGFIGAIYAAMGATNIADDADAEGFGFPQLTEEYIVEADPELIVITDQVTYSPADVSARPGWQDIAAVREGNVVVVEADTASRWGPRLPQFISAVAEALATAAAAR